MPLPPAQTQKLPVDAWQGLDLEKGILERPVSAFQRLENFDLVKHGVIRKIRGNKRLGNVGLNPIVALRDYQVDPGTQELLVAVDSHGILYWALANSALDNFLTAGVLYTPDGLLESSPFVVSLPLDDLPTNGQKNYIFATIGTLGTVKKWNGNLAVDPDNITDVGIPNPGDGYTVPYQHSVAIPQIFYQSASLGKAIYQYTTPNPAQGIACINGRRYRASWYNPTTGHDSSLFPLSLEPYPTQLDVAPPAGSITKPLGTVFATQDAQYLMAVPIFLDNLPNRIPPIGPVPPPQSGYTKIRFWRTTDGGVEFLLLPRVYDSKGNVVSDVNGAVALTHIGYGFGTPVGGAQVFGLYDGFIPLTSTGQWFNPIAFDDDPVYVVNGGSQTGTTLAVTHSSGPVLAAGLFMLPEDSNIYAIQGVGAGPVFTVDPPIVVAPANGAQLTFLFAQPVQDTEAIIPYVTAEEAGVSVNTDRVNDAPPMASWGVVYQNRLFLLSAQDPTKIVYSRIANYESFPPDNFFQFTQADFDPITALLTGRQVGLVSQGADQQLVVGKARETAKITGTDATNFAITSMFAETGIVHKRAAVVVEGNFVAWTRQGLELLEPQQPVYIGRKIKDLWDLATFDTADRFGPSFTTFRKDGELLLGVNLNQTPGFDSNGVRIDRILLMRAVVPIGATNIGGMIEFESPYSLITAIPTFLGVLLESGFGDDVKVLAGGQDGYIWQFFTGGTTGVAATPVVALAQTQLLPQDDKESRKIFRRLRFGGNVITADLGWLVSFSVDDGASFTPPTRMFNETLIGLAGKQLIVQIQHTREVLDNEDLPQISNMSLEYVPIGTSRGEPI